MLGRIRGWRSRSRVAQVDSYMRWTLYGLPWLSPLTSLLSTLSDPGGAPAAWWIMLGLSVAQCALGVDLTRRSLDHYLRGRPAPWWRLGGGVLLFAMTVAAFVLAVWQMGVAHITPNTLVLFNAALSVFGAYSLLTRIRRYLVGCAGAGLALGVGVLFLGGMWQGAVTVAVAPLAMGVWSLLTVRTSAWMLAVLWEVEAARGTQARLAVAEERLRFGRDMHDVLGRNLAVIALKSELAAQLAQRGSPAALEQMAEVQRMARESQRELREVVRGYREADLHTELVGARGVLAAAGIECRVDDPTGGAVLPPAVQSALGWVIREATTNVLRHADAGLCVVRLRRTEDAAVLTVENNGARNATGADSRGSGLAGLRERLAALGGTLEYGPGRGGTFRLTAEVPVGPVGPEPGNHPAAAARHHHGEDPAT
ncbi:sensor histidine kinase [Streptomyces sp. NPDC049577]|uniref:sensor histidine kinase n=1 Tax=Streptomyces sp. NPDC049577 TaxID=3155153 RepID=UPI003448F846